MPACTEHVAYQIPEKHSRVGYLINIIESNDAGLKAAMANIEYDTDPGGKREDF